MSVLSFFGFGKQEQSSLSPGPAADFWYEPNTNFAWYKPNSSGIRVDEHIAMTYSACWAATMLIMTAVGSLPLKLFRKVPGGGSEPAIDDPRYSLVHDTPNQDMTAMLFRGTRTAHQVNWGNGFAEIQRNKAGIAVALYPIHASRIPVQSNIKRGADGRLKYIVNNDGGTKSEIPGRNMLHIPSPMSDDGIIGKGVISAARLAIGFGIAAETHGAAYFGNSARPNLVLEGAKFRTPEAAEDFRRMWNEVHGGPANNAKPAILPPDTKLHTLQFNAEDSQFLESRQFSIEDVSRFYGVPPHAIGHLLRATNNNIEQQALELRQYTLMRWTIPFEQELDRKLLTPEERKTMFFRHVFDGLERADIKTRTDALKEQFFNGKITLNEWRALDDQPPIGPAGDVHFVQSAMIPVEQAAKGQQPTQDQPPPEEPEPEEPEEESDDGELSALREQFEQLKAEVANKPSVDLSEKLDRISQALDVMGRDSNRIKETQRKAALADVKAAIARMLSVEIHAVKHIAEKPNKFDQRLREFYDKHQVTMTRSLTEYVSVYLSATGDVRPADEVVGAITAAHVEESQKRLLALCDCTADELPVKVDECLSTWHDERVTVSV